jgi:hypothetical protein
MGFPLLKRDIDYRAATPCGVPGQVWGITKKWNFSGKVNFQAHISWSAKTDTFINLKLLFLEHHLKLGTTVTGQQPRRNKIRPARPKRR